MRKIGLLVMAFVLAFGALGIGYAYWTQDIYVNATVQNGYVQASFTNAEPDYTFVDKTNDPVFGEGDTAGVAWYTSSISDYQTTGDVLTIELSNAYPGMTATMPVTIKNTGSIPIGNINGVVTSSNMPDGTLITLTATELAGGLAVGASTSNAVITVAVPWGPLNDPTFVPHGSYSFSMTVTSTQFDPTQTDQFDAYTGVAAGTYGPP
jgi:hypothetical protein